MDNVRNELKAKLLVSKSQGFDVYINNKFYTDEEDNDDEESNYGIITDGVSILLIQPDFYGTWIITYMHYPSATWAGGTVVAEGVNYDITKTVFEELSTEGAYRAKLNGAKLYSGVDDFFTDPLCRAIYHKL